MHSDAKKPLSGSTVNSQVLLVFSHIIGSKYENGLPCDLFLAETQPPSFLEHTVFTEFPAIRPKFCGNFQFTKNLSPRNLDKKLAFYVANAWKTSDLERI